jgi:hypothetical protein
MMRARTGIQTRSRCGRRSRPGPHPQPSRTVPQCHRTRRCREEPDRPRPDLRWREIKAKGTANAGARSVAALRRGRPAPPAGPQRPADPADRVEARLSVRAKRLVQGLSSETGSLGNFTHAPGARDVPKRCREKGRIVRLQNVREVRGEGSARRTLAHRQASPDITTGARGLKGETQSPSLVSRAVEAGPGSRRTPP